MFKERILGNDEWPELGMVLKVEQSNERCDMESVGPVFHILKLKTSNSFNGYVKLKPNIILYHEQLPTPHWLIDDTLDDAVKITILGFKHPIDM